MKTMIVSFRIEEDKLIRIDEFISKYSATTKIRTRSAFVLEAVDNYLDVLQKGDKKLANVMKIYHARDEANFWGAVEKQLHELTDHKTKQRIKKAQELLKVAEEGLTSNTYQEDIDMWREQLAEASASLRHS